MPLKSSSHRPWRVMLDDCLAAEGARRGELLAPDDRAAAASWARQAFARAERTVRQRINCGGETARDDLVAAAAEVLDACAAVWQAFGPAGGTRRMHLTAALGRHVAEHDGLVLAAEVGCRLDPETAAAPAGAARRGIEQLNEGSSDPATDLLTLEHNTLVFAAIAIRATQNIDATGRANGHASRAQLSAPASLHATFAEICGHARSLLEHPCRGDIAALLSECLIIASSSTSLGPSTQTAADAVTGQTDDESRQ